MPIATQTADTDNAEIKVVKLQRQAAPTDDMERLGMPASSARRDPPRRLVPPLDARGQGHVKEVWDAAAEDKEEDKLSRSEGA